MRGSGPFCPGCGELAALKRGVVACSVCGRSFAVSSDEATASPGVLSYQPAGQSKRPKAEPSAQRSLVCGFLWWLTPIPAVLAVWYGIASLERYPRRVQYPGRWRALVGAALGTLGLLLGWPALISAWSRATSMVGEMNCLGNSRPVGQMIYVYENDHGAMPTRLVEALVDQSYRTALVCPLDHERHGGMPWEEQSSYIYMGQGMNLRAMNYEYPFVFEPMPLHDSEGAMFIFADGHGERLSPADAVAAVQLTEDTRVWLDRPATRPAAEDQR